MGEDRRPQVSVEQLEKIAKNRGVSVESLRGSFRVTGDLGNHGAAAPVKGTGEDRRMIAGNHRWDALEALRQVAEEERSMQGRRDRAVMRARQSGASWESIGRVLGVTSEAVRKRYRDAVHE